MVPSSGSKRALGSQVRRFHQELKSQNGEQAFEYLHVERGLSEETIEFFELGLVGSSDEDYSNLGGYISIPYITPCSLTDWDMNYVDIRFRRGPEMSEKAPKYRTLPGHPTRLFNTRALANPGSYIAIVEGEVDAMTLWQCGIPAIGVPGVKAWKPYYRSIFSGFEKTYIIADNDAAPEPDPDSDEEEPAGLGVGEKFAAEVAKKTPSPKVVTIPDGGDTNGFYLEHGAAELRRLIGV